jgi:hypothetical protein
MEISTQKKMEHFFHKNPLHHFALDFFLFWLLLSQNLPPKTKTIFWETSSTYTEVQGGWL